MAKKAAVLKVSTCAMALAVLIAPGFQTISAQQNPELDKYFSQSIGLSQSQIAAIRNGQPVTKALPSRTPAEVFLFGAVFVHASNASRSEGFYLRQR
jgi:hypothetical protein